ncbi:MAG: hypothetical protein HY805_04805 [Nitrospirae bacterium]|nr:hypothetical protein [Nitrospirota bacterium]
MILLCNVSEGKDILNGIKKHSIKRWLFLSRDYQKLMFYEASLKAERIKTGNVLAMKAKALRKPFLSLMADLGERYDSTEWWATKLAEKNTFNSNLFLNICYLSMAEDAIKADGNICIISDSWAVLETLKSTHTDSVLLNQRIAVFDRLKQTLKGYAYIFYFLMAGLIKVLLSVLYLRKLKGKDLDKGKKKYLIFSCVNEKSLSSDGRFKDRCFGRLSDWLKDKGYEVITFAKILDIRGGGLRAVGWFRKAFRWFKGAQGKFVIEYSYYRLSDYLFAVWVYLRQKLIRIKDIHFQGLNLRRLFKEALRMELVHESILNYRLAKRLKENGIEPDIYIDSYENLLPEKLFRLGIRKYLKGTKILSYQHAPFFPNFLNLYCAGREYTYAPDRLVTSGKKMMRIIEGEGFPKERIAIGPAFMYDYMHYLKTKEKKSEGKQIALLTPFEPTLTKELLSKVYHALKEMPDIKLSIKPHPFMSRERIVEFFRESNYQMPPNFSFTDRELYSIIEEVDCGILMATSALLEFCILGIPYVNVGSELSLSHDPTEWFDFYRKPVYTPSDIKKDVENLLSSGKAEVPEVSVSDIFEPVSERAMEAFLI